VSTPIQVNTRFLAHELTGVQRYTTEILDRLEGEYERISPNQWPSGGIPGHLWEQFALPLKLSDRLFWNPTCPGPVVVANQVITVHDLTAIEHPEWFDWKYALWHRLLTPLALRRSRHIISVSHYTKQRIQQRYGIPEEKVTVIHNGVDRRFAPADDDAVNKVRHELDIPSGPYILSLSDIQPRKNIKRLLRVWEHTQSAVDGSVTLVLAGGMGRSTIFRNLSLDNPPANVHFTGYVDDDLLPALYTGADAFVYPSLYEGFGFPVLEAMACGTAVLTSDVTSLPEVAGEGAILVDPHSQEDIRDGLMRLLQNDPLRSRLQKKGKERAASFTWDKSVRKTEDLFRKLSE
jgi:glycosyltransferase involved in cell wall biosynthesis